MKKFQYHCKLKGGMSPHPVKNVAYFKSREIFEALLKRWSVRGWTYTETEEDRKENDKAVSVKFEYSTAINTTWNCDNPLKAYSAFYGTASHEVSYIKPIFN